MTPGSIARIAAGVIFVVFGAGKFVNHASELASFKGYGLPAPDVLVYATGVLEVVAGAALVVQRGVGIAALLLAGDMVAAIAISGIARGEWISLTLAPPLLAVMMQVLWSEVIAPTRAARAGRPAP